MSRTARRNQPTPVPRTVKHPTYNRGHPPISLGGCGKGSGDPSGPTGMTRDGLSWSLPTKNPRSSLATSWRSCSRCDPRVGGRGSTGGQAIAVQTVLTSSKYEDQSGRRQQSLGYGMSADEAEFRDPGPATSRPGPGAARRGRHLRWRRAGISRRSQINLGGPAARIGQISGARPPRGHWPMISAPAPRP
jgi:hypothetical protein